MADSKSAETGELAKALATAQGKFLAVAKDKSAEIVKDGRKLYTYTYADLASSIGATRQALVDNGIAVVQTPAFRDGWVDVTTTLLHTSGQWISGTLSLSAGRDGRPQAVGSAITYARRYALQAMVGLATEDDDGAAAQKDASAEPAEPRESHEDEYKRLTSECRKLFELVAPHRGMTRSELKEEMAFAEGRNPSLGELREAKPKLQAMLSQPAADGLESVQQALGETPI